MDPRALSFSRSLGIDPLINVRVLFLYVCNSCLWNLRVFRCSQVPTIIDCYSQHYFSLMFICGCLETDITNHNWTQTTEMFYCLSPNLRRYCHDRSKRALFFFVMNGDFMDGYRIVVQSTHISHPHSESNYAGAVFEWSYTLPRLSEAGWVQHFHWGRTLFGYCWLWVVVHPFLHWGSQRAHQYTACEYIYCTIAFIAPVRVCWRQSIRPPNILPNKYHHLLIFSHRNASKVMDVVLLDRCGTRCLKKTSRSRMSFQSPALTKHVYLLEEGITGSGIVEMLDGWVVRSKCPAIFQIRRFYLGRHLWQMRCRYGVCYQTREIVRYVYHKLRCYGVGFVVAYHPGTVSNAWIEQMKSDCGLCDGAQCVHLQPVAGLRLWTVIMCCFSFIIQF